MAQHIKSFQQINHSTNCWKQCEFVTDLTNHARAKRVLPVGTGWLNNIIYLELTDVDTGLVWATFFLCN